MSPRAADTENDQVRAARDCDLRDAVCEAGEKSVAYKMFFSEIRVAVAVAFMGHLQHLIHTIDGMAGL
jgi:hypothetical protein